MSLLATLRRPGRSVPRAVAPRRRLLVGAAVAVAAFAATSGPASADLKDTVPPAQVTGVTASVSQGQIADIPLVSVRWTPTTDDVGVVAYDVYGEGAGGNKLLATVDGPGANAVNNLSQVEGFPAVKITVVARDFIGNASIPSASASVNTCTISPPRVFAPRNVRVTGYKPEAGPVVTIAWDPGVAGCYAQPPTGYKVLGKADTDDEVTLATTGPSTTSTDVRLTRRSDTVITVVPTAAPSVSVQRSAPITVRPAEATCLPRPYYVRARLHQGRRRDTDGRDDLVAPGPGRCRMW